MASPYLSVQRHALSTLEMLSETVKGLELVQSLAEELLSLSISSTVTANCRVQALEVVSKVKLEFDATRSTALLSAVISEYGLTSIIPLKEALLPLLGKLVAQVSFKFAFELD